jgi:hypothetical protein
MNKDHLLEQLNDNLEILRMTIERMKSDKISQIDIDLMHFKILQVYDQVNKLKLLSGEPVEKVQEHQAIKPQIVPEIRTHEEVKEHIEHRHVEDIPVVPEKHEEMKHEHIPLHNEPEHIPVHREPEHFPADENKQAVSDKNMTTVHKAIAPKNEKMALHTKFAKSETTINDRQTGRQDKTNISDQMQKGKITDLKAAITLNQRITFIKELFKEDEKDYKKFIDFINHCENFSEAKYYIQSETEKREYWKDKHAVLNTLMELLNRKFL